MARGKLKIAFIVDAAKRKAACKKRMSGLMKKMNELSTLCGVDVCAIIHCSELKHQPEFWPSKLDTERIVAEFKNLPTRERTKDMVDLKTCTEKRIVAAKKKYEKLFKVNRLKELTHVMYDCLAGRSGLQNMDMTDLGTLGRLIDRKLYEIEQRITSLNINNPSEIDASTSNVAAKCCGLAE